MTHLTLGLLLFLAVHSLRIVSPLWRDRLLTRWGAMRFHGVYGVLSLLSIWLIAVGYGDARLSSPDLWQPPYGMRHLTLTLMWPAMVLLMASVVPRNGIRAKLGHPMTLAVKTWALAHLLSNGRWIDVLLFGVLLIWSVLLYRALRAEDRSQMMGMMGTSSRPLFNLGTLITLVLGSALWAWLVLGGGHLWLIGVSPLG